mgnify:CR=1 FL=1
MTGVQTCALPISLNGLRELFYPLRQESYGLREEVAGLREEVAGLRGRDVTLRVHLRNGQAIHPYSMR